MTQKYTRTCSIWRALEVIGDTPTLLILESYWFGARRFEEFRKQTGLLKALLSDRLGKLVKAGCLEKVAYSTRPLRYEYIGTAKLHEQYKVSLAMLYWERKWDSRDGKSDPSIELVHNNCGSATNPSASCASCRVDVAAQDVDWKEGPGVGWMPALYGRRRQDVFNKGKPNTLLYHHLSYVIGDRWQVLIIRSIFRHLNKYDEILEDTQIATNILTDRLKSLCDGGLLIREQYQQKPDRSLYRLTEKGRDLYPILMLIMEWGDKWYPDPKGPPLLLTHRLCEHPLHIDMACSACGATIELGDLKFRLIGEATQREDSALPTAA